MEKFNNRTTRGLSYLLIYLTAIQPLHPAFAALTPDGPRTQVNNAGAVPVINIATPNAAGVSHNTYKDFSVGTPGAVLNNSIAAGQSQLAGQLNANANLNGKAADLIINEVTGSTRSDLQGKIEVFGNKANVLIANPNGITCDGCGFINTPSATLTTGKPVLDQQGALEALEVKKGSITIGGKGLDGSTTDYVDILSRATELNGKINAKSLTLTQGSNRVDFKTGTIAPIAGEGAKPLLAVDTKALGGMYAERIRLVATEDGVGANVANLTSTQQGITLDSKGKIQLGNVHAKTDLNLTAQQVDIAAGNTVKSDRDITLASTVLNNRGNIIAGEDMRLFNDSLTNTQATIQANNNLWIQKDATGNKGVKVENRSGTIKTNTGDLVIRTEQLDNVRDKFSTQIFSIEPNSTSIDSYVGSRISPIPGTPGIPGIYDYHASISSSGIKKWFGNVVILDNPVINNARNIIKVTNDSPESLISSGSNIYINSQNTNNEASNIFAVKNIFIAGETLKNKTYRLGVENSHITLSGDTFNKIPPIGNNKSNFKVPVNWNKTREDKSWEETSESVASIKAGERIVADLKESISIETDQPGQKEKLSEHTHKIAEKSTISAQSITLNSKKININSSIESDNDLTLIAEDGITIDQGELKSGKTTSLLSANNIDIKQSNIIGKDIDVTSREGNVSIYSDNAVRHYSVDGSRQFSTLNTTGNLSIQSGKDIVLDGVNMTKNQNTSLLSGNNLTIKNNDAHLDQIHLRVTLTNTEKQKIFNNTFSLLSRINSTGSITLNAGNTLDITGVSLNATKDINLTAGADINLNPRVLNAVPEELFVNPRQAELSSTINAGNQLLVSSGKDLFAQSATLSANGNAILLAGNSLKLLATAYSAIDSQNDNNKDDRNVTAKVHAGKNLTIASNGELIATGTDFSSGSDMALSSGGKMEFNAVANHIYREGGNEYSESVTQKNAVLNSGGILTLLSNGSILFQATQLIAKGALDAAAKGGFLYAQAAEESSHYEKTTTTRKWYGKKTTIRQTSHSVTNKVTEFTAGGDINLLSRDDSTYEASKINAGKNAKLTSTQGSINFKAVKDTAFEQTITTSKGFFIKSNDKGYTKDTWLLPSIYSGGQLTIDAATGITADAKTQNAQSLQNALLVLSNNPGTVWLKDLNSRTDVRWNTVQDAYSTWNHTTQSLNPVVGAVIAIAVAAVTAGSGLAMMAANGAVSATGAAGMTATVIHGAAYSGMAAITSQAAVALVDNKGNLSKTFQAMSSSDSVKSLVTSMVIGGALAGFDEVMQFSKAANGTTVIDPAKAKLPMLSKGDWSKVAQRVAGQSVISSSLGTAINGGSFKDNFTTALLSNIGSQINAEGAKFIGDKGEILGVTGKTLSHAVVAGVAAEISGGNVKGAAAGALAAELAGIIINDNLVKSEGWQEKQAQISRFAGAVMGAVATGKASGVNSGANAAEIVERFNRQLHLDEIQAIKEIAKGDKEKEMRLLAASCRKVNCVAQESLNSEERQQYETLMALYPATREEDGILANYWVQKDRQRTSNYPLYVGYDMEQLFTYTTGDSISDGQMFARNQWIENFSQMTGWSKDTVEALGFGISIASTFAGIGKAGVGNQYLSKSLVTPTAGWKSYLVNEKTIQQTVAFKQQVTDLRAGLPSDPKRSGNVAVADINIPGIPKTLAAHSGVNVSGNGLVGKGSESFKYQEIPNNKGFIIARNTDSEYKILDNISDKLAGNISAKGTVTIFTERPACGSCLGVVEQFQQRYPGIEVKILDNNGITLRPGAKK
ncbi:DUF637 domain-containing protein [Pectobacterium brasiliense]|uniref:DUF637 domain-containing protein n=1 Tax=Pectobacterium brasiliense TaxID=180957 RepID=UPI000CE68770|nr:DUF637 domain-containing protein [Pectobacterium brasiliense]MBN3097529.1 DUF637 domain-containing protein [Pectobacterium brasiliense]MBN3100823.1 DUF637 domain-containing protein [Pectobacterium brasiliense]MBN3165498.1 DUF637 domain-containing protein [Pectobacterium brasiliense]MBN3182202.1 DUF637 domain-containing protein [Pectobacterium brasiliense]PPE63779.1 hemolysin BL-binding protein [Pectobacterium brasiliense]